MKLLHNKKNRRRPAQPKGAPRWNPRRRPRSPRSWRTPRRERSCSASTKPAESDSTTALAADVLCDEPAGAARHRPRQPAGRARGARRHAAGPDRRRLLRPRGHGGPDGPDRARHGPPTAWSPCSRSARPTPSWSAQVILRIPPPLEERFLDPAVMRHAMLDGALRRIGGELDIDQMAPELINILVPHFCNVGRAADPGEPDRRRGHAVRDPGRVAAAPAAGGGARRRRRRAGTRRSRPARSCATRRTRRTPGAWTRACRSARSIVRESADQIADAWIRKPVAELLVRRLAAAPAARSPAASCWASSSAPGCPATAASTRTTPSSGMEFASRAAIFMDNAQRLQPGARHRAHAAAQHAAHRAVGAVVGRGEAPLPARQQAHRDRRRLVRVDRAARRPGGPGRRRRGRARCAGGRHHGAAAHRDPHPGHARAAAGRDAAAAERADAGTGRPRAALRDLRVRASTTRSAAPASWPRPGTCRRCWCARTASSELLDISPSPPLGVGSGPIQSRVVDVEDGSLLVLYTDGLVERRTEDIDVGLAKLREHLRPGVANPAARGPVQGHAGRRLRRSAARRHRAADRPAAPDSRGQLRVLEAAVRADLGAPGPDADPPPAEALGPRAS